MTLKVFMDGSAEVVIPKSVSDRAAQAFVAEHEAWLAQHMAARPPELKQPAIRPQFLDLAAVGERWQLDVRPANGKRVATTLRPGATPNDFTLRLTTAGDDDDMPGRVRAALIARAKQMYNELLTPLASQMHSPFRRLQVRDQKTCWGSCSSRGTISMNYAGLFLAPQLVRYLCIHELAHCHHMDHSPSFWAVVQRYEPDARALDRQLGSKLDVVPRWLW
ncbi:MAG: SprT family zinc-dependent metalloprotease [Pseudomonadota bacterium]